MSLPAINLLKSSCAQRDQRKWVRSFSAQVGEVMLVGRLKVAVLAFQKTEVFLRLSVHNGTATARCLLPCAL
jgi:hypothetical protein